MSLELICPTCGNSFRDEDYCPIDGTPLVRPAAREPLAGAEPEVAAQAEAATAARDARPADKTARGEPVGAAFDEAPSGEDQGSDPPGSDPKKGDSRLADLMSRLGLRRVADRDALGRGGTASAEAEPGGAPSPLPQTALDDGWAITGPLESRPGLDRWPVARVSEEGETVSGHFHRFRTGALTPDSLYRRLAGGGVPRLARIWAHGTVALGGARADYELVSLPQAGRRLDQWLAASTPSERRAWHLFPMLVDLIRLLATHDIKPLVLEPTQIQITDDGELWLATAAALVSAAAANEYRSEFESSALLPRGWAAPELTQHSLLSPNAAVFSLGQLLSLALWGQPCSPADLQTGAVTFHAIEDARLARVLMGCLWPRPAERWTMDQLLQAAAATDTDAMPATPPWDSLMPGASSTAFGFAGSSYWRLEALLAAAVEPAHWDEATAQVEAILAWAEGTAWVGQAKLLRRALAGGRSADWVLVALARAVRLDAPLTWRGLDLSDAEAATSLVGLAQRALRHGGADAATMQALFAADLRDAWTMPLSQPEH